jgi:hypothetical protein
MRQRGTTRRIDIRRTMVVAASVGRSSTKAGQQHGTHSAGSYRTPGCVCGTFTSGEDCRRCLALILACAFCSLGIIAAPKGTTSTPSAAATQGVTQAIAHATATSRAPTATATPAKAKAWVTVQHFTGNQNQQTPTFHVSSGNQVVWSATPTDQYGGTFSITAYSSGGTYLDLIANTGVSKPESGTTTAHQDNDLYFKIDALSCTYDIQVQVYQ